MSLTTFIFISVFFPTHQKVFRQLMVSQFLVLLWTIPNLNISHMIQEVQRGQFFLCDYSSAIWMSPDDQTEYSSSNHLKNQQHCWNFHQENSGENVSSRINRHIVCTWTLVVLMLKDKSHHKLMLLLFPFFLPRWLMVSSKRPCDMKTK